MADNSEVEKYLTVARNGEGRLTEKMSRFLAFAFEVGSADEAKALVKKFANDYHDARHVCWAYVVGPRRADYLSSDNGEPSGTAGKPILGQINSLGLTNVVVIVVRYFGGIKLGTPGLIAAYRESARLALDDAGIKEVTRTETLRFSVPYASYDKVMRLIKDRELRILGQQIEMDCVTEIEVPVALLSEVTDRLEKINGLKMI